MTKTPAFPAIARARVDAVVAAGLWGAALVVFLVGLGNGALRDWDEGTYAQVGREIARSTSWHGWLHPTYNGELFLWKPPLVLWLIAGAYRTAGITELTTRFPGAFLTAAGIPLLYAIGRAVFPSRFPAFLAAVVYMTVPAMVRHGRLAMLDGTAITFLLLLVFSLLRAQRDQRWALGVGLSIGLIGLTKGILALLLGGLGLLYLALEARYLLRSPYLWIGLGLGSLPVLLWYAAQWQAAGPLFWSVTVIEQSFNRIWAPVEEHRGPFWYYLWEVLRLAWPWVIFWPWGLRLAWQHRRTSWGRLVLVITLGYGLSISVMATKLPWYVLPIYPAFALAVGAALTEAERQGARRDPGTGRRSPSGSYVVVFAVLAAALWAGWVYAVGLGPADFLPLQWTALAWAITLTAVTVQLWRPDRRFVWTLVAGTYVASVLYIASPLWAWNAGDDYPVKPVAALIRQHVPPGQVTYTSHPYGRPALDFYAERRIMPKPADQLRAEWERSAAPYLLIDRSTLQRLGATDARVLGEAEGWLLVTRRR
jgi:4-amino-4-deoxy-L-arabinose transferase-like glycosyltransferase